MRTIARPTSIALAVLGVFLAVGSQATAADRAAVRAAEPSAVLFVKGYNLCRAVPLAAIRNAGAQRYRAGIFANATCIWERSDLKAGITLSTHPSSAGTVLMRQFLAQSGTSGFDAKRVHVTGASEAVLATFPQSGSRQVTKNLFAAYPQGVIQINMTAPLSVRDARLVALMGLIART